MLILASLGLAVAAALSGTVRAVDSTEPIPFAVVEIVELERYAVADARGVYVLAAVPAGTWQVRAQAPGYAPVTREVRVGEANVSLDLELAPRPVRLQPVLIQGGEGATSDVAGPAPWRINATTLKELPGVAEADVLRTLRDLPAVAASSDFSSALYVRGGTPDQTRILLDGAPLSNPYHLGGIFTAVNPDVVSAVELSTGGMPAEVGDRLAGELRIWTRSGGRDRVRSSGSLGLVSSQLSVDGPLWQGGSFLLSLRRTYLDLLTGAAHRAGAIEQDFPYAFSDAHLKLSQDLGRWGTLSVSGYHNGERLGTPQGFDIGGDLDARWGDLAGAATLRTALSATLRSELQVAGTRSGGRFLYGDAAPGTVVLDSLDADVGIGIVMARLGLVGHGRNLERRAGLEYERFDLDYAVRSRGQTLQRFFPRMDHADRLESLALYAEEQRSLGRLRLRAGARLFQVRGASAVLLPRLGLTVAVREGVDVYAAAGRYAQGVTTLRDEESTTARLFAYDLLLPLQRPSTSEDVVLGLRAERGATRVTVEAYRKWLHDLYQPPIPPDPDEGAILVHEDRRAASGTSRGLEVAVEHRHGTGRWAATYAWSDHDRVVDGRHYTPSFARRHRLGVTGSQTLGRSASISLRGVLESGTPHSPAAGFFRSYRFDPARQTYVYERDVVVLGEHNSARLPWYHRVDVAVRKSYETHLFGRASTWIPYVQVYNLFNSRNVLRAVPSVSDAEPRLEYAPQIPFLPSVGVEWRF